MKTFRSKKRGVSLVEVVIASAIISVTLVSLVAIYIGVEKYAIKNVSSLKASGLLEEASEVLRYKRDASWSTNISALTIGTSYKTYWNGSDWTIATSAPLLEGRYDINFSLSSVYRDASYNVVSSGGTLDSNSRKATINVSWKNGNATTTKTAEEYLFNIFNN